MNIRKEKFQFGIDFQESILQYIVNDKHGYKALQLVKGYYFELLEHEIIAKALLTFFKKKKRVGGKVIIQEGIRNLYQTRDYANKVTSSDKSVVTKVLKKIYKVTPKDGDTILESCIKFARFVETKSVLEKANTNDYDGYPILVKKLQNAITLGDEFKESKGVWIIRDVKSRQIKRQTETPTFPTPFKQINTWLNNGGFTRHSLITLMGPAKRFKTGVLLNVAKGYLAQRHKKILIIDYENGDESLGVRMEQTLVAKTTEEIYSGEYDRQIQKKFRGYSRWKAEVVIKRFPAYSNFNTVQTFIDNIYREYGVKFDVLIADYLDLMGSISGKKDDTERISDVYVDAKNFLEHNDFESGWTGSHVNKEGSRKEGKKYKAHDISKAIDKVRHADAIYGLNQNDWDKENGILRIEIVDQRQGRDWGRALFHIDKSIQKLKEFNQKEIAAYIEDAEEEDSGFKPDRKDNGRDL